MTMLAKCTTETVAGIASRSTLILPVGATEQHGPHLPLCVDAFMAERVAEAGASRAEASGSEPVVVAPVLPIGSSHHHLPYAGTLSLRSRTLSAVLADVIASGVAGGFRRLLILNGHGGNEDVTHQAVRDAVLEHSIVAAAASYWTLAWDALCAEAERHGIGPLPGHAGSFETSLMLHLAPDLVGDAAQVDDPLTGDGVHPLAQAVVERHGWVRLLGGRTDGPAPATAAAGEQFFELVVSALASFLTRFSSEQPPVH